MFEWLKAVVSCSMGSLAFLILAGTVIVGTIAFVVTGKERIMSGTIIVSLLFYIFAKLYCGPSLRDVLVMKPMAQKISDYIVKHGIPKSLEDIPGLPYRLEGCERSEEYLKGNNRGGVESSSKQQAILHNIREKCHFKNIELSYWLQEDLEEKNHISISLKMISSRRTVYDTGLALAENNQFIQLETDIGSYKNTGICNPMRQ